MTVVKRSNGATRFRMR